MVYSTKNNDIDHNQDVHLIFTMQGKENSTVACWGQTRSEYNHHYMKGLFVGDAVILSDSILGGHEGKIVQVDYRKQRAKVLFDFVGVSWSCWVACNFIISKA